MTDRDSIFSLVGKLAVVTGGTGGIGRAISLGLHRAGATVIVLDLATAPADAELAASIAEVIPVDVTDRVGVDQVASRIAADHRLVDVLVNTAGVGGRGSARDYDPEILARVLAVNTVGTFYACQSFGRAMLDARGGSIVNVSSVVGLVGVPGSAGYQASKGAVTQLTRSLAVEWAPSSVRVNAIAPGHTRTPMVELEWAREPELRDYYLSRTPMKRLAEPDDMVGAVVFLASDAASMVTGQIISIDGGFTAQ